MASDYYSNCDCGHAKGTHALDGSKCYGITPGTRRTVHAHGTTLATGKPCDCDGLSLVWVPDAETQNAIANTEMQMREEQG